MGQAFRATVACWAVYVLLGFTELAPPVPQAILGLAILLSANWLMHIAVFAALRVSAMGAFHGTELLPRPPDVSVPVRQRIPSRRDLFTFFFKATAAGAALSMSLPRLAAAACGDCAAQFGSGWLDCITNYCSTQGQYCCPPGSPYLNHCDCQCYDTTDFDCGSYSDCNYCG